MLRERDTKFPVPRNPVLFGVPVEEEAPFSQQVESFRLVCCVDVQKRVVRGIGSGYGAIRRVVIRARGFVFPNEILGFEAVLDRVQSETTNSVIHPELEDFLARARRHQRGLRWRWVTEREENKISKRGCNDIHYSSRTSISFRTNGFLRFKSGCSLKNWWK